MTVTEEMIEAGAKTIWSGGTRGLPERISHITKILSAALSTQPASTALVESEDYFGRLVADARVSADKAKRKFPQPNYVTLKIAEEAGEVVRGAVHYAENRMSWEEVEGEIVQLLAMLIRFVTEGDEINGVRPPALSVSQSTSRGGEK